MWPFLCPLILIMVKRHPFELSSGVSNVVIALNEHEVGKLFNGDTRSDIGSESEKMKYANAVNDLVVKFIRLDDKEDLQSEVLVMERLYPMDYRAYEFSKRELWLDVFTDEIIQLHLAGFVHRDLKRPSNIPGDRFDNIFLTDQGLRLIDVGISAIQSQVGDRLFQKFVDEELKEIELFSEYFLNR
jgi:serine/threonine protein kinase